MMMRPKGEADSPVERRKRHGENLNESPVRVELKEGTIWIGLQFPCTTHSRPTKRWKEARKCMHV